MEQNKNRIPYRIGRYRALDLFCGAGGVCAGLQEAGFIVTGIDIKEQPDYPGKFILGDALDPPVDLKDFDFIWASPPCQAYSVANNSHKAEHPMLIEKTRKLLAQHYNHVTCIENVTGAPIREDLTLTLPMFGNFTHPHRRIFELSFMEYQLFPLKKPKPIWGDEKVVFTKDHLEYILDTSRDTGFYQRNFINMVGAAGHGWPDTQMGNKRKKIGLPGTTTIQELEVALGIHHIKSGTNAYRRGALNNAVPPAYARYIGEGAKRVINNDLRTRRLENI